MKDDTDPGFGTWIAPDINPMPWTSPEASIVRRGGKLAAQLHKSARVLGFQEELREYLKVCYDPIPLDYDVELRLFFWRHLDSQNRKADVTNLQKSTEDALHGLLFLNDSQVRRCISTIVQQGAQAKPGIVIEWEMFHLTESDMDKNDTIEVLNGRQDPVSPREDFDPETFF